VTGTANGFPRQQPFKRNLRVTRCRNICADKSAGKLKYNIRDDTAAPGIIAGLAVNISDISLSQILRQIQVLEFGALIRVDTRVRPAGGGLRLSVKKLNFGYIEA
jgi:hypothetical protein